MFHLATLFWNNWGPDYRYSEKLDQSFFSVFAIFFPSGEFSVVLINKKTPK